VNYRNILTPTKEKVWDCLKKARREPYPGTKPGHKPGKEKGRRNNNARRTGQSDDQINTRTARMASQVLFRQPHKSGGGASTSSRTLQTGACEKGVKERLAYFKLALFLPYPAVMGDRRENPGFQSGDERRLSVTN